MPQRRRRTYVNLTRRRARPRRDPDYPRSSTRSTLCLAVIPRTKSYRSSSTERRRMEREGSGVCSYVGWRVPSACSRIYDFISEGAGQSQACLKVFSVRHARIHGCRPFGAGAFTSRQCAKHSAMKCLQSIAVLRPRMHETQSRNASSDRKNPPPCVLQDFAST